MPHTRSQTPSVPQMGPWRYIHIRLTSDNRPMSLYMCYWLSSTQKQYFIIELSLTVSSESLDKARAIYCLRRQPDANRLPRPNPWVPTILGLHVVESSVHIPNIQFVLDLEFVLEQYIHSRSQIEGCMETVCDLSPKILYSAWVIPCDQDLIMDCWIWGMNRFWNLKDCSQAHVQIIDEYTRPAS